MKCEVCGAGERRERQIRYPITIDDKFIVVEHVPAIVCDNCGEISLKPDVVAQVQKAIWGRGKPDRVIETEVYEFS